jgi:phosphoserine phosphatase RsbU/P
LGWAESSNQRHDKGDGAVSEVLQLEPGTQAPAQARRWLADACQDWGCLDLAPDALVLVSELTTNAVLHARTSCSVEADFDDLALMVRVSDEMPGDLTVEGTAITGERGRGLQIVDAIANAWGVTVTETGKSVWFALWPGARTEGPTRAARIDG